MYHNLSVWPQIIQGGMGVGVSNWRLAKAVSQCGEVGTVSIVEIGHILARRLQLCRDVADIRRACRAFPVPGVAERIFNRYHGRPEIAIPKTTLSLSREGQWLTILGSFIEVWLAKEGHGGKVAANMLAKVDMIMLPTLLGALWAEVDAFIIGAGLPIGIPEAITKLAASEKAWYSVEVLSEKAPMTDEKLIGRRFARTEQSTTLDVQKLLSNEGVSHIPPLQRPAFIPIVSLEMAAKILEKKIGIGIDGYYIEDPMLAGGHNPSPRKGGVSSNGEPLYTEKDLVNFAVFRELGRPFWIAGGQASPMALKEAIKSGAQGIACGSIFALSNESGISEDLKREARRRGYLGELHVRSSLVASPTGYPFQVVSLPGTLSDPKLYEQRKRTCVIGNLQTPVKLLCSNNKKEILSYRCAAEPIADFEAKGGTLEATAGRICLCQGLLATIGLGFPGELPIVTLGKDLAFLRQMLFDEEASYSAREAVRYLLGG